MSDKLRIIKKKLEKEAWIYWVDDPASRELSKDAEPDVLWLISELEQLNALFDLQHTRTQKAEHLWRIATGNHNIVPDLGVLIDWLIRKA